MRLFSKAFPRAYEWLRNMGGRRPFPFPLSFLPGNLLFIHIPKNAGTSISEALYGGDVGHHPVGWYRDRFPHSMRNVTTFAVVRNPVTRFCSAFYFLKKGGMNREDARFAREKLASFPDPLSLAEACLRPGFWRELQAGHHHFKTQSFYVDWQGRRAVDFLFRFEDLPQCLETLPGSSGWLHRLAHRNATPRRVRTPESPRLVEHLKKICPEDFRLWQALGAAG